MEKAKIVDGIKGVIGDVLNISHFEWKGELKAEDIGGWDSLTHMIIIAELENVFSIKFRLKELNKLTDLESLANLIQSKV